MFPGIAGITFGASGIFYVSYNSTGNASIPEQSVAELRLVTTSQSISSTLLNASVFSTYGSTALPGALAAVGSTASLPSVSANEILELEPDGQLLAYNPSTGAQSAFDNLPDYTAVASHVFDVQTGKSTDLSDTISLAGATYGDFDVFENSLVIAAESNGWDFVLRVSYGSSGGVATVLAASPIAAGLADAPQGVGIDSTGMVLATLPYVPAGSATAIDAPVGFNLFYDNGSGPAPFITKLGLTTVPDIDSGGITVDSSDNFLVGVTNTSLFGGGPGSCISTRRFRPSWQFPTATRNRSSRESPIRASGEQIISRSSIPTPTRLPTQARTRLRFVPSCRFSATRSRLPNFGMPMESTRSLSPVRAVRV